MMHKRLMSVAALVLLGVVLNAGCGRSQTVVQTDAGGRFADAVQVYQSNCISCHGNNLQGDVGPALKNIGSKLSPAQIQHQIYFGGGPMPGYGHSEQAILTDKQIEELTNWLSSKK